MTSEPLQRLTALKTKNQESSEKEASDHSFRDFLTLPEVAIRLGVSEATVYARVKEKLLHPVKQKYRGRLSLTFNADEVESELDRIKELYRGKKVTFGGSTKNKKKTVVQELSSPKEAPTTPSSPKPSKAQPNSFDGADCARAVALFRQGKQQLDAVVEMNITFELAKYFWDCYQLAQSSDIVSFKVKDFTRVQVLLGWHEDPPTIAGLETAIRSHAERTEETPTTEEELTEQDRAALASLEQE